VINMTIDSSQLSPEQQAFLKANPELLKSLGQEIPKQAARVQTRQKKLSKGKSKLQRDLEEIDHKVAKAKRRADELRREYMVNPHLREINEKCSSTADRGSKGLVCPVCGEPNGAYAKGGKPNKKGEKPWCLKCDSPLVPADKLAKWRKMPNVKAVRKSLNDEFKRRGLDF